MKKSLALSVIVPLLIYTQSHTKNHLWYEIKNIQSKTIQEKKNAAWEVSAPLSIGDLYDKITILQVKKIKITDPEKLKNIELELILLQETLQSAVVQSPELDELSKELREVNAKLWEIEDSIRAKEAKQEFDEAFIQIARSVYINNGIRHDLKRKINEFTGSTIKEEKQYTKFK